MKFINQKTLYTLFNYYNFKATLFLLALSNPFLIAAVYLNTKYSAKIILVTIQIIIIAMEISFNWFFRDKALVLFENNTNSIVDAGFTSNPFFCLYVIPNHNPQVHNFIGPAVIMPCTSKIQNKYYIYGKEIPKELFYKIKKCNKNDLAIHLISEDLAERKLAEYRLKEIKNAKSYFNFNWISRMYSSKK